jgi:hypothetical protein
MILASDTTYKIPQYLFTVHLHFWIHLNMYMNAAEKERQIFIWPADLLPLNTAKVLEIGRAEVK